MRRVYVCDRINTSDLNEYRLRSLIYIGYSSLIPLSFVNKKRSWEFIPLDKNAVKFSSFAQSCGQFNVKQKTIKWMVNVLLLLEKRSSVLLTVGALVRLSPWKMRLGLCVFSSNEKNEWERGRWYSIEQARRRLWKGLWYDQRVCLHVVKFLREVSETSHPYFRVCRRIGFMCASMALSLIFSPGKH